MGITRVVNGVLSIGPEPTRARISNTVDDWRVRSRWGASDVVAAFGMKAEECMGARRRGIISIASRTPCGGRRCLRHTGRAAAVSIPSSGQRGRGQAACLSECPILVVTRYLCVCSVATMRSICLTCGRSWSASRWA